MITENEIWFVFDGDSVVSTSDIVSCFKKKLRLVGNEAVEFSGKRRRLNKIEQHGNEDPFEINYEGHGIQRVGIGRYGIKVVNFWGSSVACSDLEIEWALANPGFVMGWIFNREYDYWQNAADPILYSTAGIAPPTPLVSNGLPSPLEKSVVDISRNPGRRTLRKGYVEAVGSFMILSPLFWERTRSSPTDLTIEGIAIETDARGLCRVRASHELFKTGVGEGAALQARLRKLLFGSV